MPARERTTRYLRLNEIQGAKVNPKLHDRLGIETSITEHGLAELPLLDERTGRIVAGHGRIADLNARRKRGANPPDDVGVDDDGEWLVPVQGGWASRDDAHAAAYLAASNRLSENGGWDMDVLPGYLEDLADANVLELSGFTPEDLAKMLGDDEPVDTADELADTPDRYNEQYAVIVICRDESDQEQVYEHLKGEGYTVKVVST